MKERPPFPYKPKQKPESQEEVAKNRTPRIDPVQAQASFSALRDEIKDDTLRRELVRTREEYGLTPVTTTIQTGYRLAGELRIEEDKRPDWIANLVVNRYRSASGNQQ